MLGIFLGLLIGFLQTNLVYVKSTSPGTNVGIAVDNNVTFYRGWPLANAGMVGYNDSFHNPPKNSRTYSNIGFWVLATPVVLIALYVLLRQLALSRRAKIIIFVSIVVGMVLGGVQIFYTKNVLRPTPPFDMSLASDCDQKVAGCGYCPELQKQGNFCTYPPFEQKVRGWPLSHDTYDQLSRYDKSPTLLMNFALISGSFTVVGALAGLVFGGKKKRPKSKNN